MKGDGHKADDSGNQAWRKGAAGKNMDVLLEREDVHIPRWSEDAISAEQ